MIEGVRGLDDLFVLGGVVRVGLIEDDTGTADWPGDLSGIARDADDGGGPKSWRAGEGCFVVDGAVVAGCAIEVLLARPGRMVRQDSPETSST